MTARPRVATVLTAREWETNLATAARATSAIRLVARAYEPSDLSGDLDVVVAGAETAWVTPSFIKSWQNRGVRVLGLHPPGDGPARRMLEAVPADEIRPDSTSSIDLIHLTRVLGLDVRTAQPEGGLVVVTGPHGAPGRTEVAVALAHEFAKVGETLLLDLDTDAPSVSMRLGLTPSPSTLEAEDAVRSSGLLPDSVIQRVGSLGVVVGSLGRRITSQAMIAELARAATQSAEFVVADMHAWAGDDQLIAHAEHAVLVCDASPIGLIRGAEVAMHWSGPTPAVVLNRVSTNRQDLTAAARRAIGLDPAVMVADHGEIRASSVRALPPVDSLRTALAELVRSLCSPATETRRSRGA